ncbi:MAG: hypothetical protein DMF97_22150, partial [Acidobacteria bacterium]
IYSESMYPRYHFGWSELYALTDGRFRYIQAPQDELYDLERDSAEARNLAAERRQTRDAMRLALTPFIQPALAAKPQKVAAEDLEKFQALGYIGVAVQPTDTATQSLPDPKDKIGVFKTYRQAIQLAHDGRSPTTRRWSTSGSAWPRCCSGRIAATRRCSSCGASFR